MKDKLKKGFTFWTHFEDLKLLETIKNSNLEILDNFCDLKVVFCLKFLFKEILAVSKL